jgi:BASS family bile acid:Na+ symporter
VSVGQPVLRVLTPLHDRLVVYVIVAAAVGLLVPDTAARLAPGVPLMLAGQVLGVALTLTAAEFIGVVRRPLPVVLALAAQWTVVPLVGLGLAHAGADPVVSTGILIVAVAPAEITSALVAVLAGGSGAVAATCMAGSLASGTVLTPLWLSAVGGAGLHVDSAPLIGELALSVVLPLVVGVALRTSIPAIAHHGARALDLSGLCVVLVVFVSVGAARTVVFSASLLVCVGLCLALLVACLAAGLALSRVVGGEQAAARALVFPIGMREFGIAAAVALVVSPPAVAVAGVYGALMMVAAPLLARVLRARAATPGTRPAR